MVVVSPKKEKEYYFAIRKSMKRFVFFSLIILFLYTCYICVSFQLVAFVREHK